MLKPAYHKTTSVSVSLLSVTVNICHIFFFMFSFAIFFYQSKLFWGELKNRRPFHESISQLSFAIAPVYIRAYINSSVDIYFLGKLSQ